MHNKNNRKMTNSRLEIQKLRCQIITDKQLGNIAIQKTAESIAKDTSVYYLLKVDSKSTLHDAIKRLNNTRNQAGNAVDMYSANFAYNITFPSNTVMLANRRNKLYRNISSLAVLLRKLEFDNHGQLANGPIILNIDIKEEGACLFAQKLTAKILQQFIYLDLSVPVVVKQEYAASNQQHDFLFRRNTEKDDLAIMNITIVGTKKAGKSALANSLLGAKYAVISSDVPTPNRTVYRWNAKGYDIMMRYAGKIHSFGSIPALNDYVQNEFLKANAGSIALPEMQIDTPFLTEAMQQFAIIDTPGSNFASAEAHALLAYNSIEKSDICIFVLNYSSHLTDDEAKLFAHVYHIFATENRLYSLIVVINRIDERYASDDTSDDRVIDYIKMRLGALGFKGFLVFGVTSLLYFYLNEIKNITGRDQELLSKNYLNELRGKYRNNSEITTYLSFIKKFMRNLEDFHDIDVRDVNILYQASGIPLLIKYIMHIAQLKNSLQIKYSNAT